MLFLLIVALGLGPLLIHSTVANATANHEDAGKLLWLRQEE